MLARLGAEDRLLRVQTGRRAEDDDVDIAVFEHVGERRMPGRVVLSGKILSCIFARLSDGCETHVVDVRYGVCVDFADIAGSDDSDVKLVCHRLPPLTDCILDEVAPSPQFEHCHDRAIVTGCYTRTRQLAMVCRAIPHRLSDESAMKMLQDWYKKDVSLEWAGVCLDLAVAQELFSSHEVDAGSRLLLKTLDPSAMPERGLAVDYGCGYGVLGLAWKATHPGWRVQLIDRDALAVAFSDWNATRLGFDDVEAMCDLGLQRGSDQDRPDLVLWNVPGKIGESVVQALTLDILDRMVAGGLLALVVVHPLADAILSAVASVESVVVEREDAGKEHRVLHIRRLYADAPIFAEDPFTRGVFDRERVLIAGKELEYDLAPVVGLPEFDAPSFGTSMVLDALAALAEDVRRVLVVRPGQGHVPLALAATRDLERIVLLDRDELALRTSARGLELAHTEGAVATARVPLDVDRLGEETVDAAIVLLDDDLRPPVMHWLQDVVTRACVPEAEVIASGKSTQVSRWVAAGKKRGTIRERGASKRRGMRVSMGVRKELASRVAAE